MKERMERTLVIGNKKHIKMKLWKWLEIRSVKKKWGQKNIEREKWENERKQAKLNIAGQGEEMRWALNTKRKGTHTQ